MSVNKSKTQVVHFRPPSVPRTDYRFMCGEEEITCTDKYRYLGLLLSEHLDYHVTAKAVAQAAGRALGLLIAKCKSLGGVPYSVYTKLFESCVVPVITYGAAIWGTTEFSCINAIQHRACRFFLGVGKYTPNAAIMGDMGWTPIYITQWKSAMNHWFRLRRMDSRRINYRVYKWSCRLGNRKCRNWSYRVTSHVNSFLGGGRTIDDFGTVKSQCMTAVIDEMMSKYIERWTNTVNRSEHNKLRTYKCFKQTYETEPYVSELMSKQKRSAYAKFRCGVAPLRIETGRYEGLDVQDRLCFNCQCIENERHVLLECELYNDIRKQLFENIVRVCIDFNSLSDEEKFLFILSNRHISFYSAKACSDILIRRRTFIYR